MFSTNNSGPFACGRARNLYTGRGEGVYGGWKPSGDPIQESSTPTRLGELLDAAASWEQGHAFRQYEREQQAAANSEARRLEMRVLSARESGPLLAPPEIEVPRTPAPVPELTVS